MSDVKASEDPVPVLLEPGEISPVNKSVAAGLVGLEYLAKQAFEEKRRKQCLEITNAILKIEPDHVDARSIQVSVRTDLERDFASAQAASENARLKNDPVLYGRAIAVLRRIVDADPDNMEAQSLLHETVANGYFRPPLPDRSRWRLKRWSILIGSVAVVILAAVLGLTNGSSQVSAQLPAVLDAFTNVEAGSSSTAPEATKAGPELTLVSYGRTDLVIPAALRSENPDRVVQTASVVPSSRPMTPPDQGTPAPAGSLAVSAVVPAEIYRGDQLLGSTPATLQLPPGPQTLEYRYQGLRQTLTHIITSQQTTMATVSFLIKVQINAKPWAQVFMEGTRLTPIGQTPLGDVSVPVGSVLVFQNPGFPDKRYRVTAKDAEIQIAFP